MKKFVQLFFSHYCVLGLVDLGFYNILESLETDILAARSIFVVSSQRNALKIRLTLCLEKC
jgi:hypothetical protein